MTNPSSNITIIGVGRLGLCMALALERSGYHVLGVDVSDAYIQEINQKTLSSLEPKVSEYLKESRNFRATTSIKEGLDHSDLIFIVVPTNTVPTEQSYDHTIVSEILQNINREKVSHKHIVISSTVFPGYIANEARALLADCPQTSLSYNPEFIAQGDIIHGTKNPDMVLIGEGSKEAGDWLEEIYKTCCPNTSTICRMSVSSAEITKLSVNCFITMKIAFANLVADIADETPGANKVDILQAVGKDCRIGERNLKPGYGFGGPCFPRDNRALGNYASKIGIEPTLFRATDTTNKAHANYQAQTLFTKDLPSYLFEDIRYKENCPVPIIEESQKLVIAEILANRGKQVIISDTEDVISKIKKEYKGKFQYKVRETHE